MSIVIHWMYPHPDGSIKTGGSQIDLKIGEQEFAPIIAQPNTWRVACGLLLPWVEHQNHRCTEDPKAASCPDCKRTKAYVEAMEKRGGGKIERVPVEMADATASRTPVGTGRPERPLDHAGTRKPG